MKRRHKVRCDHPTPLGLPEQYQEVLRLRCQVLLAETDQHAARLPSYVQQADPSGTERPASRSSADPHSERVE